MGAFSNMDYELQNSEAAVSDAFTEDDAMDMPQAAVNSPATDPTPAAVASEPATAPNIQIRTRPHSMRDRRSNSINSKSCYVHAEKHGDHHHNGHNLSFHDHSPYLFIELSRSSL